MCCNAPTMGLKIFRNVYFIDGVTASSLQLNLHVFMEMIFQ